MVTPALPDYISKLPLVIQKMIGPYLKSQDLSQGAHVSKLFQKIMNDNAVWVKVAKEYNITLKDSKNAKKELQDIFQQINEIALSCLGYEEEEKLSSIKDPFVLSHELEEHYKKDAAAQKALREMNERIVKYSGGEPGQALNNPDVLYVHRRLCQQIRSRANSLQSDGINMLERVLQDSTGQWGNFWKLGINAGIVLIQNGMVGNNPKVSDKSNFEYWTEAFKKVFGWRQGYAINMSEPLFQAVFNQFKKAEISDEEKKSILNNVFRLYLVNPSVVNDKPIKKLLKMVEPDEGTLVAAMVQGMGQEFIDHSSLNKDELLAIVDFAEKKAFEKAKEDRSFDDDIYKMLHGHAPSHVADDKKLADRFTKLRDYISKR